MPVPTQASAQMVGALHCPAVEHVSTCVLLVHCVLAGTQTPEQALLTQALGQLVEVPHCPSGPHVWIWVSEDAPEGEAHRVESGTHWPPQLLPGPVPTQAKMQVDGVVDHSPFVRQVCTCVSFTHSVVSGTHTPPQLAPTHAAGHWDITCTPAGLHVSSSVSLTHLVNPGTQSPLQLLPGPVPTQASGHACGEFQLPSALQVSTSVSLTHSVVPGEQFPPQVPVLVWQVDGHGVEDVGYSPLAPQTFTSFASTQVLV
jgi:hypothetical protein